MTQTERALAARIGAHHNDVRRSGGLAPLYEMSELAPHAAANGERMMASREVGHSDMYALFDDFAEVGWAAENALVMYEPAPQALDVWLASPPHAANLGAVRATHLWVDVRCEDDGRMWVTAQYVEAPIRVGDQLPTASPQDETIDLRCPRPTGPFGSTEQFVAQQYRDFLGREPEANGLVYWTDLLNRRELTEADVVMEFLNSAEFAGRIRPHAQVALAEGFAIPGREQVATWMNGSAVAPQLDAAALADGVDGRVDVFMVYVGMLDRSPDMGGFRYWVALSSSGASLGELINGFFHSSEYRNRIAAS